MNNNGLFITFEGPDGSGKTTILKGVEEWMENVVKKPYIITKEPGAPQDEICVNFRNTLLNGKSSLDNKAELFLMLADRSQHIGKVVLPELEKGKIVISDRYIDSTYAYQGWGRCLGSEKKLKLIEILNYEASYGIIPDLTILVMVDPNVGIERIKKTRSIHDDTFEKEGFEFQKRVHEGYLDLYERTKNIRNIYIIDSTSKSEKQCIAEIVDYLSNYLDMKLNSGVPNLC
jgi:dTMP kinase